MCSASVSLSIRQSVCHECVKWPRIVDLRLGFTVWVIQCSLCQITLAYVVRHWSFYVSNEAIYYELWQFMGVCDMCMFVNSELWTEIFIVIGRWLLLIGDGNSIDWLLRSFETGRKRKQLLLSRSEPNICVWLMKVLINYVIDSFYSIFNVYSY